MIPLSCESSDGIILFHTHGIKYESSVTALETTIWNSWGMLSALVWMAVVFDNPSALETAVTTFVFLFMESHSKKSVSGKRIARGIPGKPPPVPTSSTELPGLKLNNAAIDNECNT